MSKDFKFVTISHPEDIRRCQHVRKDIRRHVMREIGEQRRGALPSAASIRLPSTALSQQLYKTNLLGSHRPLSPLGSFPIPGSLHNLELVRFGNAPV